MMKSLKCMASLGLIMAMVVSGTVPTYADNVPEGYDAETWTRLQDNALEYGEIENLIKEYNPDFQLMKDGIAYGSTPFVNSAASLREEAETFTQMAKEAAADGDAASEKNYRAKASELKKQASSMENSAERGSRLQVNEIQKKLTAGTQTAMIGYNQIVVNLETLKIGVELAQAAYESTQTQRSLGMATDADVQSAQKTLEAAKSQLQTLEDQAVGVRQTLCMMTGWSYDAIPEIGKIPAPELSRIATMNPQADIANTWSNNYAIIAMRNTKTAESAARKNKDRSLSEAEEKVMANLEGLYQTVLQSKTTYEAADTAFQSAQITMNGNDLKYQMGMLGRLEYLQTKIVYQQAKAAQESAAMDLTQAMENYDWAVNGLAEIQ